MNKNLKSEPWNTLVAFDEALVLAKASEAPDQLELAECIKYIIKMPYKAFL